MIAELESDVRIKVSSSLTEGEYMPSLNKVEKAEFHKFGHPPGNLLYTQANTSPHTDTHMYCIVFILICVPCRV